MPTKQFIVDKPSGINQVAPTYHDIVWHDRQALPKPHREIDYEEFFQYMFLQPYGMMGKLYAQLFVPLDSQDDPYENGYPRDKNIPLVGVTFFWFPHYGVAIAERYTHKDHRRWSDKYWVPRPNGDYGNEIRFFKIGCDHDYSHNSRYMFDHTYTCKKCGHTYSVDSSG